jgi:hypothetical protein
LNVAIRKQSLNNPNMVRTKQYGANRANEGIGSVVNNGRQLRPYR